MNNKTKKLLNGAIEECSKITQFCSKAMKFGLFSHHPNEHATNGDKILTRYYRLQAIIEKLQRERVLPTYSQNYINALKRESVYNNTKNIKTKDARK
jgi:hypothetical protein